jgi:hypothetical protein
LDALNVGKRAAGTFAGYSIPFVVALKVALPYWFFNSTVAVFPDTNE